MTGTGALHDDPRRWLEREVSMLEFLMPSGLAVSPSRLIAPGPHHHDGLWMTFTEWVPKVEPDREIHSATSRTRFAARSTGTWRAPSAVSASTVRTRTASARCSTPTAGTMSESLRRSSPLKTSMTRSGECMTSSDVVPGALQPPERTPRASEAEVPHARFRLVANRAASAQPRLRGRRLREAEGRAWAARSGQAAAVKGW